MDYEIKTDGNEPDDLIIGDESGLGTDDDTDLELDFSSDEPELWPSMFDDLPDDRRVVLLNVLAEAWAGNLERPESDDDALIDMVLEEVGQDGLAKILVTAEGFPRSIGGLMLSAMFLDSSAKRITKVTRYKQREVETTAASIHDQVLHGAVVEAQAAAIDALSNLHKSLSLTRQKSRRSGRLRTQAEQLRTETTELLLILGAPVPADEGTKRR